MKKKIITVAIYVVIALILQTSVLALINYKYLAGFSEPDKKAEVKPKATPKPVVKKNIIDGGASDIKAADSNKYVAFIKDNQLKYMILDKYETNVASDTKPYFYKWLFDDEILLVNNVRNNGNNYEFYVYNVDKKEKSLVGTLKLQDDNSKLEDVVNSSMKNLIFAKVQSNGRDEIYKLNLSQNQFEKVDMQSKDIDNLYVIPHEDKFVYKPVNSNKFYISYISKIINIREKGQQVLLGVDDSDKVFIGIKNGDNISKIYYGLINESIDTWSKVQVKENMQQENIVITRDGKILSINAQDGVVKSVVGDKELSYKGTFLSIKDDSILSINNNEVILSNDKSLVKN